MKNRYASVFLTVLALILLSGLSDAANDRYVRLRYAEGDVILHPSDGQRPTDATINTPLLDGDEIEAREGRAELAFRNGIIVRIGDYSAVRIESAYSPLTIALLQGTLFVDSTMVDSFRDVLEVRAADVQVYLIDEGNMRVDLGQEGSVRVTSIEGEAEVRAAGRRVLLEAGERTYVDPGRYPEAPAVFAGETDDLDSWNESRTRVYAGNYAYGDDHYGRDRYVDESIYYEAYDLDNYGDWRVYGSYGYVWVPQVSVGWRPYYDGRWIYCNSSWFWVSYDPWGWAPYHYGRWGWTNDFGWYWIPGRVFGPAWVTWYDYGDYIGWCPLNYYNRPITVFNNNYYNYPLVQKQKTIGVNDTWTFVKKKEVGAVNIKRATASPVEVRKIPIDEKRIGANPHRGLVSYVLPKSTQTDAYVNDKRIVKEPGDIHNPVGTKHREEQFERPRSPAPRGTSGAHPRSEPSGEVAPRKGTTSLPSRDWEKERGRPEKSVPIYRPGKSSDHEPITSGNSKQNRDQQFSRPTEDRGRPYGSYVSPYYREREADLRRGDASPSYLPWFRDAKPSTNDTERRSDPIEVSPRFSDEAKKVFQRFEESKGSSHPSTTSPSREHYRAPEPPRGSPPKQHDNRSREKQGSSNKPSGQKPQKH